MAIRAVMRYRFENYKGRTKSNAAWTIPILLALHWHIAHFDKLDLLGIDPATMTVKDNSEDEIRTKRVMIGENEAYVETNEAMRAYMREFVGQYEHAPPGFVKNDWGTYEIDPRQQAWMGRRPGFPKVSRRTADGGETGDPIPELDMEDSEEDPYVDPTDEEWVHLFYDEWEAKNDPEVGYCPPIDVM